MIYDHFRVTGAHDAVLDYADLFSVILRDDNVQEFDTRWDEVLLSMSKIPSDDVLENSVHIENTWVRATQNCSGIVRDGDSSKDIDAQLSKIENDGEKKYRSETPLTKLWRRQGRIETGAVVKNRKGLGDVEGGKGICYQWKEKRPMFEGRPMQFLAWE